MVKRLARRFALSMSGGTRWTWASAPRQLANAIATVAVAFGAVVMGAVILWIAVVLVLALAR